LAAKSESEWKRFSAKNKKKLEAMDLQIHALHDKISERTDCLQCANCCRSLGPRITDKDVERMAKTLRMKAAEVISKYLKIDEDNDLVFQSMPCPFLGSDNYCSIYENRPKACREYPHTDRKRMYQILGLTHKNCEVCPVVFCITDELAKNSIFKV
jgi:Fe-S-cluster containining protein